MADVKNIKEVLVLLFAIIMAIVKEIKKDGFQFTDLLAFMSSDEFKVALGPAMKDLKEIPAEIKDIDLKEGFELGAFAAKESFEIVKILLGKK